MKQLGWALLTVIGMLALLPQTGAACTAIIAGKDATADGSVINSHLVDSHRTSPAMGIAPRRSFSKGSTLNVVKRVEDDSGKMKHWKRVAAGEIEQVPSTQRYFSPAYPIMNEHQLAIGESTFSGRKELQSEAGLFDCQALIHVMMQRAQTAREAIRLAGELLERHGWNDAGEGLTITDTNEAWIMEIVGPGENQVGAIWAAQRVPDNHISIIGNGSRIRQIHLDKADYFMASSNVVSRAVELGLYDPQNAEPFEFVMAYAPENAYGVSARRREWRIFDLVAPSLKLNPDQNHYPFSVQPEKKLAVEDVMALFRDYFEGTPYDITKNLTVVDEKTGQVSKSPVANPFMSYDANKLHRIDGPRGWHGERAVARWYTMYAAISQSRGWLPAPIGGLVWFGLDNTAMTTWVPIYLGVEELPDIYKVDGRATGYSRESAWWAFNRLSTIAGHRWGEMRVDVAKVRDPLQAQILEHRAELDREAQSLYKKSPKKASRYLTKYLMKTAHTVTEAYWDLGDLLWTKYDELW